MNSETLIRFGTAFESAMELERQAHQALDVLGIHGVFVSAGESLRSRTPASHAARTAVEAAGFQVRDTPTRRNPRHKTVELPHPVTAEDALRFNAVFGR